MSVPISQSIPPLLSPGNDKFVFYICDFTSVLQISLFLPFLFSSVQSLSCIWLFVTPWTEARQASLSITNSQSLLKLMSIELVMPSNHLILCHPFLLPPSILPSIRVFSNESALCITWLKYWGLVSVLPMSLQGWLPLGLTGLISLLSEGLSRVFSSTTVWKHQLSYLDFCWQSNVSAF